MAKPVAKLSFIRDRAKEILRSAFLLARHNGYSVRDAKCVALGALDRARQHSSALGYEGTGWSSQYEQKLRAIKRRTAQVGQHRPETYDRLINS